VSAPVADNRPAAPALLSYRPWRGELHGPGHGTWAIARVALLMLMRRRLFWGLYGFSLMIFLFFFYLQYLHVWVDKQLSGDSVSLGPIAIPASEIRNFLAQGLELNGSGYTFRNLISFEGYIVMIVLALAGSVIMGNDFRFGSLPFYLSKPVHRWHYLIGKFLAVAVFANLMTTLPALVLYVQYGLIESWRYYFEKASLLLGIIGYGLTLSIVLGLILLATSVWLKRTVPLIMVWTAIFVFARMLADLLARFDPRWRLIDVWNNLYLVGNWCLWMPRNTIRTGNQPAYWEAAAVLAVICAVCLLYLNRRIQAVEVVT
jgi:ABC-type transport system involved in multi-copper enzyme maturation permease subunit